LLDKLMPASPHNPPEPPTAATCLPKSSRGACAPFRRRDTRPRISCCLQVRETPQFLQDVEHPTRLLLVDSCKREADVNEDIVPHLGIRDVLEAHRLRHTPEGDLAHMQIAVGEKLDDSTWDGETHRSILRGVGRSNGELAEAQTCV